MCKQHNSDNYSGKTLQTQTQQAQEHIGRLARMSVLDTEVDGSNPAAVCRFLEQDTLSALLQSTQQ